MSSPDPRSLIFRQCETKAALKAWIKFFLGIELPDRIVSEESNSCPMDFVWEVYDRQRRNDIEGFSKVMAYASRFGGKTLSAAILEVMTILHLDRNAAHMAAITRQSKKAQEYVKGFFRKPYLRDFVVGDSQEQTKVVWFRNKTGGFPLTTAEYSALPQAEKMNYEIRENYIRIVVCNMAAANGEHVECVDAESAIFVRNKRRGRKRKATTARGVFGRVAGFSVGGNPSKIETHDMVVRKAKREVEILSLNMESGQLEWKRVLAASRSKKKRLKLSAGNRSTTLSHGHPIFVFGKGYIPAGDVRTGDRVLILSNPLKTQKTKVNLIKRIEPDFSSEVTNIEELSESWVYDFTVEDNHNFFADSFLVHNCAITDEVDVIPKQNIAAYHQAKSIPSGRGGKLPISILTSTRKSRIGLVQKEIDEAEQTGLQIRHWNIIDVTEPCAPQRHRPAEPKKTYYINDDEVRHIKQEDYDAFNDVEKKRWYPKEGFSGCGECRLFAACKGRLATHQTGDPAKIAAMSPILDVIAKFKDHVNNPEYITTEFLCRKPDATGLIYPRLKRDVHLLTPQQMATTMFGEDVGRIPDKGSLVRAMLARGVQFHTGMDFGFTHHFATATLAVWGDRAFVVDCISSSGLELDDKLQVSEPLKSLYNSTIYGDTAYPESIKVFRKKGFKMKDWSKTKAVGSQQSVKAGIEIVRMVLSSGVGTPRLFFLKGDPGVEYLFKQLDNYSFKVGLDGEPTEDPVKDNDDAADALRYAVVNIFAPKGNLKVDSEAKVSVVQQEALAHPETDYMSQMNQIVNELTGGTQTSSNPDKAGVKKTGRFFWSDGES